MDEYNITEVYTGERGYAYHILQREGGSVSFYASRASESVVYVIYDSLDNGPPRAAARVHLARLAKMREAINALLSKVHPPVPATHTPGTGGTLRCDAHVLAGKSRRTS